MAKKSTAARQAQAARRPQTTAKQAAVTLVRTPRPDAGAPAADAKSTAATPAAPTRAVVPAQRQRPVEASKPANAPAAKPAAKAVAASVPAQAQTPAKPQGPKAQAARVARARAAQRARAANLINPMNYSYVLNDLKLIAGLAVTMFAVIIILHFVLPA